MPEKWHKIVIIGAGAVGTSTAFSLLHSGLVQEIVLVDLNKEKAVGEAMDLNHGVSLAYPVKITVGNYADCAKADIIIITAGSPQKQGESRLDLVQENTAIMKDIVSQIAKYAPETILLVVTNPVDILTYVALKLSSFPENKVIGSGTVLDSSRLRYLLSLETKIDTHNIHAYVLGEHGNTEFIAWSQAHVAGIPLTKYYQKALNKELDEKTKNTLASQVREAAFEVIAKKQVSHYAIALALNRICRAILRGERSVLTVSTLVTDTYGVKDVCLSLPCVIGRRGIEKKIPLHLEKKEQEEWLNSATTLKKIIAQILPQEMLP